MRTCLACYHLADASFFMCDRHDSDKAWDNRYRTLVYGQFPIKERSKTARYWTRYRKRRY